MERMTIQEEYRAKHPRSAALAERARAAIPGGITHDIRHLAPFPTYIDRASGTRKWDVDGHEYVDYWMGHGALFLGHCHPAVVTAVQEQVARGTHVGASHELEVRWAELVNRLVPCAELTRFTMSGTEATHLAMRVARAATGRTKILKFTGHFHGWHDGAVAAVNPPYEVPMSAGIPGATPDLTTLAKIVAGGLPGGALCGRRELMSMLTFRGDPDWDRSQRVAHAGTFNANPLSAAAAIATLELVADASLQAKANKYGEELRRELADAMKRAGAPGTCYGEASIFHVSFEGKPGLAGFDRPRKGAVYHLLRCALLNNGVDCSMNHGWISALHSPEDLERTRRGYDAAFRALVAEGAFRS